MKINGACKGLSSTKEVSIASENEKIVQVLYYNVNPALRYTIHYSCHMTSILNGIVYMHCHIYRYYYCTFNSVHVYIKWKIDPMIFFHFFGRDLS